MKEKYFYEADGGSIMIGNKHFRACFPNCYGDGCFSVEVTDNDADVNRSKYKFMGNIEGDAMNVYNYDCATDFESKNDILCTVSGRYGVYASRGNIILARWE